MDEDDRRKNHRFSVNSEAPIDVLFTGPVFTGLLEPENISPGGFRFVVLEDFNELSDLPTDSPISFIITLNEGVPFGVNGLIGYKERTGSSSGRLGLEFTSIDEDERIDIENYITIERYRKGEIRA